MLVFVIGVIVGVTLWVGGSLLDSADRWVRPAAGFAGGFGFVLVVASVSFGVLCARVLDTTGVKAVRGTALRFEVASLSLLAPLGVVLKLVATRSGVDIPVYEIMFAGVIVPFVVWRAVAPSWRAYDRVMKHPNDYCHGCGYRLLPEQDRCPECGWDVARRTEK